MPPPAASHAKRMTANPLRPIARYRPGKALAEEASSDDEESAEDDEPQPRQVHRRPQPPKTRQDTVTAPTAKAEYTSDGEEGFVTEEEDEAEQDKKSEAALTCPRERKDLQGTDARVEDTDGGEEYESSEGEEGLTEEESSSEEEPQRKFLRPTFIKKEKRNVNGGSAAIAVASHGIALDEAAEQEEARRKEMADLMIKDKLERDAAARAAGRKAWDDDDDVPGEEMVDDTDDLDPEAELAAWKVRELKRLKRDRDAIEAREREIEEKERRANLTQAERDAEDEEHLGAQKAEREGRAKAGFMQRYHHKGAFFQDEETAELLRKRDLMGAKFVDQVQNREALPQYMQLRDMSKLGRKGNTRYKDLRSEDTGRWGEFGRPVKKDMDDVRGGDARFQPDRKGGPTGANASAVLDRRKRSHSPAEKHEKRPRIEVT